MKLEPILQALCQKASLPVLLILLQHGKMKTRELLSASPFGQMTTYRAINELLKVELISDEKQGYPLTRIFSLTSKGQIIAKRLQEAIQEVYQIEKEKKNQI